MGKNIETYPYVVDKKYDTFEIHSYEAVCLLLNSPKKNLKRRPVRVLHFSRIYFEEIKRMKKIAMTSPVTMSLEDL
jgi:hypothetical protein